ncbi:putative enzyme related to lactoylglutathione lyase [Catenulispora sp. GAS73]|uniref:VOC family protein n=1 Tax=Catenulispora sp. GAS73 TaxID=3156269 RepID=UPI0035118E9D
MTNPPFDTVAWFQIGSTDPGSAQRFYGGLFGWNFTTNPAIGDAYRFVTYPTTQAPSGGILTVDDAKAQHGTFAVMVRDVEATCARADELGGKVLSPPVTWPNGLVFADLLDADGNRFMVFSPQTS